MNQKSNTPKTLAFLPIDSEHILACKRVPVAQVMQELINANKSKWITRLQDKAKYDCCRRIDNLEIEAWYSKKAEADKKEPDVYKFYCRVCETRFNQGEDRGYCHAFFCVGGNSPEAKNHTVHTRPDLFEIRPYWEIG